MGRLRDSGGDVSGGHVAEVSSTRTRADALSDAAYRLKRTADGLIDEELARHRMIAAFAGCGGVLSLVFGLAIIAGLGQPQFLSILAGIAVLVPTAYAFSHTVGNMARLADASYERGFSQALAQYAKRLGDSVGSTDQRNVLRDPEAIINGQLDVLYRDLDRAKQRLKAAGADAGQKSEANRLHERIVPNQTDTNLVGSDGRRYPVRIVDVSQSGVAVRGVLPPLYQGEQVQVGTRRAKVVNVRAGQVAVAFLVPILPSEFNKKVIL